ncbi:hypothetical protein ZIOFF_017219 [Zingiber officinale]|uniref:SET domain-containing protein n=1 Tax=Zingiber officinale TaxID=94328 RepID=A0A8J5HBG4_ZINOF|nr:hypothetical protein ZIOFF_017219 [Zingiber officinale]
MWGKQVAMQKLNLSRNHKPGLLIGFNSWLSFRVDALAALEGTLLFEELLQSKEHLRQQFDASCPQFCDNYPDIFERKLYSWDKFLWACELWYSNSMKVIFADGKLRTCLVPIAGFLNHSLCPHIVHCGRVDPVTKSLKLPVSLPREKGNQHYLSYGNLPSSHFLMFYGFLPNGDNFYDVILLGGYTEDAFLDHIYVGSLKPIETSMLGCQSLESKQIRTDQDGDHGNQPLDAAIGINIHMVRGTWLSNANKPHAYGWPPQLCKTLDCSIMSSYAMQNSIIDKENERNALETILSISAPMLEGLCNTDKMGSQSEPPPPLNERTGSVAKRSREVENPKATRVWFRYLTQCSRCSSPRDRSLLNERTGSVAKRSREVENPKATRVWFRTCNCIHSLLQQKQRDIEFREGSNEHKQRDVSIWNLLHLNKLTITFTRKKDVSMGHGMERRLTVDAYEVKKQDLKAGTLI